MGSGAWSDTAYRSAARGRKAFAVSDNVMSRPRSERRCNQLLDPYGLKVRESRDSAEHPESNAVMIGLDVTSSMGSVVVAIRDDLGNLMGMLLGDRYISDPQLLFYAVGDASPDDGRENGMCDAIPFQVSQFESDIRINDQITKVVLEGGGGGQCTESYELGFYVAARHTSIDCWEKRKRKGYLVTIGDEMPYPKVSRKEVKKIFNAALQEDIPLAAIAREAQEKYHTFHVIPRGSNHYNDPEIRDTWAKVLGAQQYVLILEDPAATAATIAVAIGINEGAITLAEGVRAVAKSSGQAIARVVESTLADFAAYAESQPKARPSGRGGKKTDPKTDPAAAKDKKDWKL